jgi:hypothetical protein
MFSALFDPLIGLQIAGLVMVRGRCVGGRPYCYRDGLSDTQVSTFKSSECRLPLISWSRQTRSNDNRISNDVLPRIVRLTFETNVLTGALCSRGS